MKTIVTSIAVFLTLSVNAQTEVEESQDTTRFKIVGSEIIIISKTKNTGEAGDTIKIEDSTHTEWSFEKHKKYDSFGHWSGIEIGMNTMLNTSGNNSFNQKYLEIDPNQSWSFSFNFNEITIPFKTPHVGLVSGFAFEHSRYGFKNDYLLNANSDSTWAMIDSNQTYLKNQLRTWSFNVPLLLEFNTSKYNKNNVYLNLGVIAGVRFGTKTFRKYETNGGVQKDKFKGRYNINPFNLSATARVGYKNVGLFVNYSLLPLFASGATELAYPLTFGIRIG